MTSPHGFHGLVLQTKYCLCADNWDFPRFLTFSLCLLWSQTWSASAFRPCRGASLWRQQHLSVPRASSTGLTGPAKKQPFVAMPFPPFTESSSSIFDGHAEKLAASYMKWLGYSDARTNGTVHSKDRGIDIISANGVAQVKANFRGDVKRNIISQLIGDASVPAYVNRDLLFFAVSYAQDATSFVQELKGRGIMLFTFNGAGKVKPLNAKAVQKVSSVQ